MIPENCWFAVFSRQGLVKKLPLTHFSIQTRGGKGNTISKLNEGDVVAAVECLTEHSKLLLLTSTGRAFLVGLGDLPEMGKYAKGKLLPKILPLEPGEIVTACCRMDTEGATGYITFVTANGILKKSEIGLFQKVRGVGTRAITLDEGDFVKAAFLSTGSQSMIVGTRAGKAIRFAEADLRATGKGARGVKAIRLQEGDQVIGALAGDEHTEVLTVSEKGFAKRTKVGLYRESGRAGQGVTNLKSSEKVGTVKALVPIRGDDTVASVSDLGKVILVDSKTVRETGRGASGVMLMRLSSGDRVAYVTKVG